MALSQPQIDSWWAWATGVLNRIGAPTSGQNYLTLWNWSLKESGGNPMRWNNPLNTTQTAPGSRSQNSVGVQSYPDVSTGVAATAQTLTNGRYPHIVQALKGSQPTSRWTGMWSSIAAELKTWGSGTNWLNWANIPPTPSANFQSTLGVGSNATAGNQVTDATGAAVNAALGPVGTAITGAEQNLVKQALYSFEVIAGVLLILAGLALLAVMAFKSAPAPVKQLAGFAANLTPQGRAVSVAKSVAPKREAVPENVAAQRKTDKQAGSPALKRRLSELGAPKARARGTEPEAKTVSAGGHEIALKPAARERLRGQGVKV